MRISEVARRAGVSVKAVRYYESLGLVTAQRSPNGYRWYDESQARRIEEIRDLGRLGIVAERTRPFLDCLASGAGSGDDCPPTLSVYREAIADLDDRLAQLARRRDGLVARLAAAETRTASSTGSEPLAPPPRCDYAAVIEEPA